MSREAIGACERLIKTQRPYKGRFQNNNFALKRFFNQVDGKCKIHECWIWIGSRVNSDVVYGTLSVQNRRVLAHRFIYETFFGSIPRELNIDHMCNNGLCVNPYHLQAITQRENSFRNPRSATLVNFMKTHCIRGHEFNEINTRSRPGGGRQCRICVRLTTNKLRKARR